MDGMTWICILFFSFSSLLNSGLESEHDIHISKCNVHYKTKTQSLQIIVHLFLDDLELALTDKGGTDLAICTENEDPNAEEYIDAYLNEHLLMELNDEALNYTFIGKEISEDIMGVYCYLEVENLSKFKGELRFYYNALMEVYDDQQNIISLKADGKGLDFFLLDIKSYSKIISL